MIIFQRKEINKLFIKRSKRDGGREIRTPEGLCHWILSPAPIFGLDPFLDTTIDQIPEKREIPYFLGNPADL